VSQSVADGFAKLPLSGQTKSCAQMHTTKLNRMRKEKLVIEEIQER